MSFNPTGPAVGPVPGAAPGAVPGAVPRTGPAPRSQGAGLVAAIGAGAMLLVEAVLLLASLIASGHVGYLGVLFGLTSDFINSPTQFTSWDVALCAVLAAGAFGCLGGRDWGRSAVLAAMVMVGYTDATALLSQLRSGDGRSAFTQGHNLWFNLILVVEVLIAVGTFVAVLVTSSRNRAKAASGAMTGPVPGAGGMPTGAPAQGYPQHPAPGYAQSPMPPQAAQPPAPGYAQPPVPGQVPPPGQVPAPGYAQPPVPGQVPPPGYAQPPVPGQPSAQAQPQPSVPPQAGPVQQPTPTQEAMAYRPTEFAPPPAQPGQPPAPSGG